MEFFGNGRHNEGMVGAYGFYNEAFGRPGHGRWDGLLGVTL